MDDPTATVDSNALDVVDAPDTAALNLLPSVLAGLRDSRRKIGSGADPIDIPIPGYEGKLIARFRWVPVTRLAATAASLRRIKDPTRQQLAVAADALAATNDEILTALDEGEPEALMYKGLPVSFANGEGLAVALGFPPQSARDTVFATFNNEYALVDVAQKVMQWLEDTSRKVDETFMGE